MEKWDFIPYGVEFVGPFTSSPYKIVIGGYRLPNILAYEGEEDMWTLVLDERFATEPIHIDVLRPMLPFLANCMAVSAGYSCFGESSVKEPNPFKVGMMGINSKPNLQLVPEDPKP